MTSTLALNAVTLPYIMKLAQKGYKDALANDTNFLAGLNVCKGQVTYKAVAQDLGYEYVNDMFIDPSTGENFSVSNTVQYAIIGILVFALPALVGLVQLFTPGWVANSRKSAAASRLFDGKY